MDTTKASETMDAEREDKGLEDRCADAEPVLVNLGIYECTWQHPCNHQYIYGSGIYCKQALLRWAGEDKHDR